MGDSASATILIVEDDTGLARLQRMRLERAGYRVRVADSAEQGLQRIREQGIDLIVLDHRLPGQVSGLDLYQEARGAGFDVPAILVTGFSDDRIMLQAFRAGVYDFVPKSPDYLDHLLPAIARVLDKTYAQRRVAESEARLSAIIGSALDVVLTVDAEGKIGVFNRAAEELFACSVEDAHARTIWDLLPAWPKSLDVDEADSEVYSPRLEADAIRCDGSTIPIEISIGRVKARPFFVCFARDIRDRRRAAEERERRIHEQAARAEAESANRAKDEFLAILAHELRNPLAPIRNAMQIMKLASDNPEAIERAREMTERQLHHLVRLVDDLLDLSRITRNKIELRKNPVELATVISHAVETSRPLIEASGHQLEIELPPQPVRLVADLTRLAQVVANLLNNSARYTKPGGKIWLTAFADDANAMIRVRDNGIGIAADMLPNVFGMFVQANANLERAQGGLGIGLTLVKRLIEMHGGTVEAKSEGPGKGSEFIVRIPLLAETPANIGIAAPPKSLSSGAQRILIIDDHLDSNESLATLLRVLGHEVYCAHTGAAALEAAVAFQPRVVFCDIGMPDMTGFDVCRKLRQEFSPATMRIIALTGFGGDVERENATAAGFDDYLIKPAEIDAIEALLVKAKSVS